MLEAWPEITKQHRNAEFFAVPFTGYAALVTHDETDEPAKPRGPDTDTEALMSLKALRDWAGPLPYLRKALAESAFKDTPEEVAIDFGWKLLSNERPVRFTEMEYHVPFDVHADTIRSVMKAIETHRNDVFFPIEARIIAPDDAWMSPFQGGLHGSIAVHAYYKDDNQFLFDLIEPILKAAGGRPHWGKLHSLKSADFVGLYPKWPEILSLRRSIDPGGRMLNAHLREVFGEPAS
jgi:FAD/FMN-containing dehydrogenase